MQKNKQQHKKNRFLRQIKIQVKHLYRQGFKYLNNLYHNKKYRLLLMGIVVLVILILAGGRPSREQKLCMDSFAGQFNNAKSVHFKKLTLCPAQVQDAGQIYIGTIAVKNQDPMNYACLIIKNQAIVDFERAPAFFYLDSIADKMSLPAKKILCHDIQSLFQKYVQENCATMPQS